MKTYRRHAFPPLVRLLPGVQATPDAEIADTALTEDVLEEYRKAGHEEGRSAGYAEGFKAGGDAASRQAQAALDVLGQPLETLLASISQLQTECQASTREHLVGLVDQVARQVIRTELKARPAQILSMVDEALAELPKAADDVSVRLHPDEYQRVLKAAPRRAERYRLAPDPQLQPGECRVSAGERELDVGCAQRLATCIEQIHAQWRAEPRKEDE